MSGATPEAPLLGSCLCGGVRLRITGPFLRATYCHCRHCQKRTGSAFSAQARVAQEHFELLASSDLMRTFTPPEGRPKVFCGQCGSSLFSGDPLVDAEVSVRLGILEGDPAIRPEAHLYADSAPRWRPLPEDGLTRYSGPATPQSSSPLADHVSLLVVKVGGSLFSDKRLDRTVDEVALEAHSAAIALLAKEAPGRVVFVSGGGAFGHAAARELDLGDPHAALPLTEANFALKWKWTQALRAQGAPALPLQVSAFCTRGESGELQVSHGVLRQMLAQGALPVLSGDAIVCPDGALKILGSDRVPEALLGLRPGSMRVVTLTNVPGLLMDRQAPGEVLREIDPEDAEEAMTLPWSPPAWDTSSSMAGKLRALVDVARQGAECFILQASPERPWAFLLEPVERWPQEMAYTRISRRAASGAAASTG